MNLTCCKSDNDVEQLAFGNKKMRGFEKVEQSQCKGLLNKVCLLVTSWRHSWQVISRNTVQDCHSWIIDGKQKDKMTFQTKVRHALNNMYLNVSTYWVLHAVPYTVHYNGWNIWAYVIYTIWHLVHICLEFQLLNQLLRFFNMVQVK